ncbi:uncharacterized protein N7459_006589 [Penicillium hispanicum]|uniref:uncharacterized protein n=1 Tax=Penicillium hispanicum TaxID=1080232 RepID=UPI0025408B3F|nr:uncharacterized protein N7459_006589 [Penicillium hispanicum]KAJ5577625.1 hypothetical protein N7459_006589 [Penicillium hispanicum]
MESRDSRLSRCDISQVSDETLTTLFDTTPTLHTYKGTRIVRVSHTLVLKGSTGARPCEANILNLVAGCDGSETIRVPKVHRVLNIEPDEIYGYKCMILMDLIDAVSVEQCWGDLKQAERVEVVSQVASMISTLRFIPLSQEQQARPGPVGRESCVARGYWLTDIGAGPFKSKEHMETWFNRRLDITKEFHQAPDDAPLFHFGKLVLTHLDIALRNLIVDFDRNVWLIDWGDAGIYPDGSEIASTQSAEIRIAGVH